MEELIGLVERIFSTMCTNAESSGAKILHPFTMSIQSVYFKARFKSWIAITS
ncbi:MAG: hypothetical protein K8R34_15965 [Methanosarcinales archaeon]|nr:hypothetical protein [Methanosarcinales archaeon]